MAVPPADKGMFPREALEMMERHGDIASEAFWEELAQVLVQYWNLFGAEQSPLSNLGMLVKCGEMKLKIRTLEKAGKGERGTEALEAFRAMMGEVLGAEGSEFADAKAR